MTVVDPPVPAVKPIDILYRFGCCALTAAEQLLTEAEIPLPDRREVIAHGFDDVCCSALLVRAGDSRNLDIDTDDCDVVKRSTTFEVYYSRCVNINGLDGSGDCTTDDMACHEALVCPGDEPHVRPTKCDPAEPKALESLALMEDRWLIETYLAAAWKQCLCTDNACTEGCDGLLSCRRVKWVATFPFDEGGCGGFVAEFEVHWP